jgi:hypothetical protein
MNHFFITRVSRRDVDPTGLLGERSRDGGEPESVYQDKENSIPKSPLQKGIHFRIEKKI